MKVIIWVLNVMLGTAGQNLVLQEDAGTLLINKRRVLNSALTPEEASSIVGAVSGCYSGPMVGVTGIEFRRGTGANAGNIYASIVGERTLTQQDAEAKLNNGESISMGLQEKINVQRCQVVGAEKLGSLASALARAWDESVNYLTLVSIERVPEGVRFVYAEGVQTATVAEAINLAVTQDVEVLGRVVEQ